MKGFRLFLNSLLLFKSSHHLLICIPDLFISLSLPIIKKEKKAFSRAKILKSWAHFDCWLVIILHVSPNTLDDVLTSSKLWQIALFIIETLQNNFQYGLGISQSIKETHSLFYVYLKSKILMKASLILITKFCILYQLSQQIDFKKRSLKEEISELIIKLRTKTYYT